ncbi:MAG: CAP domain-containing protein [Patescibacteria group bacterium]|nr:CAP domain-containing protein [Patescibacteria group bacterium]
MAISTKPKPKAPSHHKKRQAAHHRKSKQYVQSYWPYLPMLLVVALGITVNSLWANHGVLGDATDYSSTTLLSDTNTQRAQAHEADLTIDPQLTAAAQAKAEDMAARNYWAHDTPDGKAPWAFITAAGYNYELAGENLAYGFADAQAAVNGWMNSPTHRANVLNAGYQQVGFGVVTTPNYQGKGEQTIVVAEYGKPSTSVATIRFTVPPTAASVAGASASNNQQREPATQLVSRLQLLTNGQPTWTTFAVTMIASSALLVFVIRHGLYLRRLLVNGEVFVARHPKVDFVIVTIATIGFVVTRTSGLIR